jgi:glycosyltransferase involved in cell wall biosynthesis
MSTHLQSAVLSTVAAARGLDAEIIVVADGCKLQDLEPTVRTIEIPKAGIVGALNAGIQCASKDYVVRMDSDDICHSKRFKWLAAFLRDNPDVDVVAGAVIKFGKGLPTWETPPLTKRSIEETLLHAGYAIAHPAAAIKRNTLEALGGYRFGTDGYEDVDLWLRILKAGGKISGTSHPAIYYRVHDEQASTLGDAVVWTWMSRKAELVLGFAKSQDWASLPSIYRPTWTARVVGCARPHEMEQEQTGAPARV